MPADTPGIFLMENQDPPPVLRVAIPISIELRRTEVGAEGEEDGGQVEDFSNDF